MASPDCRADCGDPCGRERWHRKRGFDERHFRATHPLQGGEFTLLPADV